MKQINLLEDSVSKVFLNYLIPSVSATLVTSIYILADTMMIGRSVGEAGIAALNILLPLYTAFYGFGMMCGIGGSVLFGFSMGKGKVREARGYFTTGFIMSVFFAILCVLICNVFFTPITTFMGATDSMAAHIVPYGRVLATAAPAFIFSSFLQAFVRNDGAPKLAMAGVMSGGVTNVVLDYLFIFVLDGGMGGAALATALGSVLTVSILSTHFLSKNNQLKFTAAVTVRKVKEIIGNGLASFILEVSNGFVMLLFNLQLLAYVGDLGVVVYGIISNLALVVNSLSNGMSQAIQPLLSTNYGAGKNDRVRQTRKLGAQIAFLAGAMFTSVGLLFPKTLSYLFLDPSEEVLAMAVWAIRLYFTGFLVSEWNIMGGTYFQAVVKPKYSLLITLLRGVVLNSLMVFLLPALLGVSGIWMAVAVSEFITAAVVFYLMKKEA